MTIGKLISLPLEERFNLLIKERINNSFINEEGDLINIFSSPDLMNKELLKKGIDYRGMDIDDLILEIEELCKQKIKKVNIDDWIKTDKEVWDSNTTEWEQLKVLKKYVLELAFYTHDYQYDKMNLTLKKHFEHLNQFSSLLRKHKFNF